MFKLENTKKLKSALLSVCLSTLLASSAMASSKEASVDGAVKYPTKDGKYSSYYLNTQNVKNYEIGRTPTKREIAAWNVDVKPDGTGLPEFDMKEGEVVLGSDGKPKKAEGSVELGNELYDAQCAMCHGDFGSGGKGYPTLAGGSKEGLKIQRLNPADENPNPDTPNRTIGSYWPQASTLIWYIRDAMPYAHPKSYTPNQMYAMTAYLLAENGVKIDGKVIEELNKDNFKKVVMPNRDGFYPNIDGPKGVENVKAFYKDPKNFGAITGTRCMTNCGKESVMKIANEITAVVPPYNTAKDLPKEDASKGAASSPAAKAYEKSCAVCHKTDAMGAPAVGAKAAWTKVMEKGMDKVNHNAINGINGMPAKGGAADLTDDQVKEIVKFMVESSK